MENVKHPFNLYDFFGYLFPGITFCSSFLLCGYIRTNLIAYIKTLKESGFSLSLIDGVLIILFTGYIMGHIISALSSYFWERRIVEANFGFPSNNMFFNNPDKKLSFFTKYRHGYSKEFQKKFKALFEATFDIQFTNSSDIFWLSFEFVAHNCPTAFARASNFLNLYGFSRNLSMAFFLGGIFMILPSMILHHEISITKWIWSVVSILVSLLLFNNYLKLLRMFNDEVFRAFYSSVKSNKQISP